MSYTSCITASVFPAMAVTGSLLKVKDWVCLHIKRKGEERLIHTHALCCKGEKEKLNGGWEFAKAGFRLACVCVYICVWAGVEFTHGFRCFKHPQENWLSIEENQENHWPLIGVSTLLVFVCMSSNREQCCSFFLSRAPPNSQPEIFFFFFFVLKFLCLIAVATRPTRTILDNSQFNWCIDDTSFF